MSEADTGGSARGAIPPEDGNPATRTAAHWLSLAAAPTFALMALVDGIAGGAPCSAAHGASPFDGMVLMYLLMSAFHSAPWLKAISASRGAMTRDRQSP